jgi:hypothetical protein
MIVHLSPTLSAAIAIALISVTAVGAGAVVATASPSAVPTVSLLDGKTFVAPSGEKGKQASNKDTIVFRDGRFLS